MGDPIQDKDAATKQYVDNKDAAVMRYVDSKALTSGPDNQYLKISGGNVTGDINMKGNQITYQKNPLN